MKVVITGVAGFVGSAIARRLLAEGHTVLGIDSVTDYYDVSWKRARLEDLAQEAGFRFVEGDLNDLQLDPLLDGADVVFHEAGQPGVRLSWGSHFGTYLSANVAATQKLLEAAQRTSGLQRLVYASSSSVYGDAERFPTLETDRPQPRSPYGVTKLAAEHLCSLYAANYGVPTVSLRYFTVYGPGQRPDMAFTRFTRAAATGEQITIFGDGTQIRDFTFIDDVVQANLLAATADVAAGSVYNVAGGSNISVNGTLEILGRLSDAPLDIRYRAAVAGDVFRTGGSTEKIERELGWRPTVSIEDGLAAHHDWAVRTFSPVEQPS